LDDCSVRVDDVVRSEGYVVTASRYVGCIFIERFSYLCAAIRTETLRQENLTDQVTKLVQTSDRLRYVTGTVGCRLITHGSRIARSTQARVADAAWIGDAGGVVAALVVVAGTRALAASQVALLQAGDGRRRQVVPETVVGAVGYGRVGLRPLVAYIPADIL